MVFKQALSVNSFINSLNVLYTDSFTVNCSSK